MSEQLNLFGEAVGLKEIKRTKSEVFNDYNSFVDKFETKKKTTDDCYTPPAVYDAVLEFVKGIYPMDGVQVVRPFMPGGDYENFEYPERCAVVDNPPFSILAKIVRFYCAHDIPFFLFAPALTLFTAPDCDITYLVCGAEVIYENKANVCTSFITNMLRDTRIWVCPQLTEAIESAQRLSKTKRSKVAYPSHVVTAATLQRLSHRGVEFMIPKPRASISETLSTDSAMAALCSVGDSCYRTRLLHCVRRLTSVYNQNRLTLLNCIYLQKNFV